MHLLVIIFFTAIWQLGLGIMIVELALDREDKWQTKKGWIENVLLVFFWEPVLLAKAIFYFLISVPSMMRWIYNWWKNKPDA